jgi:hypothetical protein
MPRDLSIVVTALAACDPADDVPTIPDEIVTCDREGGGEVMGAVIAEDGSSFELGLVSSTYDPDMAESPPTLVLFTSGRAMFIFLTGYSNSPPPPIGEYMPSYASAGRRSTDMTTLIVDASTWDVQTTPEPETHCFAGRFESRFDEHGTLAGWFRTP